MRMIILSALFALGLGIAGAPSASAAPMSGISHVPEANAQVQDVQYYRRRYRRYVRTHCRNVRVCRYSRYYHRRICRIERVCYRR